MTSKGTVLQDNTIKFPKNTPENEEPKTQIFEEIQIETFEVSEIRTENKGTRFARLKRVLRKRSASIL
ncbi:MAG TPA: hypothetical protein VGC97_20290 [Pyrinomonadaceae bacterium]|jgi:hypothetical protein